MGELISIIMPAFAIEKHLPLFRQALSGIINQTHKEWELLIICDGGFKTTVGLVLNEVKKLNDKRIRVYKNTIKSGPGIVRNAAYKYTKGSYLTFHDSDDFSMPDRFEKLMAKVGNYGAAISNIIVQTLYDKCKNTKREKIFPEATLSLLIDKRKVRSPFHMSCAIISKKLFKNMGGFEPYKYSSDAIFAIKFGYYREMLKLAPIPRVGEFLYVWNRHSHSITTKFENAYTVLKCQKVQRKPLVKQFRPMVIYGKIKIGANAFEIKKALNIVDNLAKTQGLFLLWGK